MNGHFEIICDFLSMPEEKEDEFADSEALQWIDWKEENDSIIECLNILLPEKDHIIYEYHDSENIFLIKNGVKNKIPYCEKIYPADATLRAVSEYLYPEYSILFYTPCDGDTLAFCIVSAEEYSEMKQKFTAEKVNKYFCAVDKNSYIFDGPPAKKSLKSRISGLFKKLK